MATLGKAFVIIQASLLPLKKGLALARRAVTASMRSIARTIRRASIVIAGALTGAVVAAAKFREQMAFVSTMLSQTAMPAIVGIEKQVRRLGETYGQASKDITKAGFDILSAQIPVEKSVGVLEAAAKAAVAGRTDIATATRALIAGINGYGIAAEKATEISDKFFATVTKGLFEFPELADNLGRVASLAKQAGISFEELLAILAGITRQSITFNEATTAVVQGINAFLKPQEEAIDIAGKYGVILSSNTLKTVGWVASMKKLKNASAEEIVKMGGRVRAFKALNVAIQDNVKSTEDLRFITEDFAGQTTTFYDKMAKEVSQKFRQLKQTIFFTFVDLGEPLLGPVKKAFSLLSNRLKAAQKWLRQNKDVVEEWGDKAVDVFQDAMDKVQEWFDLLVGGKAKKAFDDMFDNLEKALTKFTATIGPTAAKLGLTFGTSFIGAFWEGLNKNPKARLVLLTLAGGAVGGLGGAAAGAVAGIGVEFTKQYSEAALAVKQAGRDIFEARSNKVLALRAADIKEKNPERLLSDILVELRAARVEDRANDAATIKELKNFIALGTLD